MRMPACVLRKMSLFSSKPVGRGEGGWKDGRGGKEGGMGRREGWEWGRDGKGGGIGRGEDGKGGGKGRGQRWEGGRNEKRGGMMKRMSLGKGSAGNNLQPN